MTFGPWYWRK